MTAILPSVALALSQFGDPTFRAVFLKGVGITVALLLAAAWGTFALLGWLLPDTFTLPWIGTVGFLDEVASGAGLLAVLVASIFLMVPVASAVTGFFLDDVADAVEARHHPRLRPARRLSLFESAREAAGFLVLIVLVNLAALVVYLLVAPLAPFVFWAVNGFLLGREYFQLVALRRVGREGAKRMRRRHAPTIWLAGILMAVPLTVPVVNLAVPILGAATFAHLFHRLWDPARVPPLPGGSDPRA